MVYSIFNKRNMRHLQAKLSREINDKFVALNIQLYEPHITAFSLNIASLASLNGQITNIVKYSLEIRPTLTES